MRGSLTNRARALNPPQLERMALDADVDPELGLLMSALGFDVADVRKAKGLRNPKDKQVLIWARRYRRILVCHDRHRDRKTRLSLYPEIWERGGQIIELQGGSDQDPYEALAKLLRHRATWLAFFAKEGKGRIVLTGDRCKTETAFALMSKIQGVAGIGFQAATRELEQIMPLKRERPKKRFKGADSPLPESAVAFDPSSLLGTTDIQHPAVNTSTGSDGL